jgi:RNA polymerase sigma-70 factor, ECF subfamily
MRSEAQEITEMLNEVRAGNSAAANRLMEAVYSGLRGIAHHYFASERPDHTLQPTALVHEAYIRIFSGGGGANVEWQDRNHFFAVAAQQMRRILVDHGREHRAGKRGGGLKVALEENHHPATPFGDCDVEIVDDLLDRLQKVDAEAARVVEMKFFAGMTDAEVAGALGCSHSTVRRHWTFARAWLTRYMGAQQDQKI